MTHTHTYALVTKEGREFVEDQIVPVYRRLVRSEGFFLPTGHYEVHTITGPHRCEGPIWILYDPDGFPYPCEVHVFEASWSTNKPPDYQEQRDEAIQLLSRVQKYLESKKRVVGWGATAAVEKPPDKLENDVSEFLGRFPKVL